MKTVTEWNREQFEEATGPVLIQVSTSWCLPCKALMPQVAKVSIDRPDITVYYVDVEKVQTDLDIQSVPKLFLVHGPEWIEISGRTADAIKKEIDDRSNAV